MALSFRRHAPVLAIAAVAIAIAWLFAAITLRHTRPMSLPLDDSYIYLTYAKQFGRAQPFSYYPGGGYSAGSTSVLWPMVLAPFWTVGLRGHALVWVSYLACSVLYALTAIGCYRLAKRLAPVGGELAGIIAAALTLAIAPFAFTALSGMEVAFASALLVGMFLLLADTPRDAAPNKKLIACLAAAALSRPEAMLICGGIIAIAALDRVRQRRLRAAAIWFVPLAAPVAWLVANKVFAGQFFPNTGVAKSHFYLPGFDWSYWMHAVVSLSGKAVVALFWSPDSPLVLPKLVAVAWLAGSVLTIIFAIRARAGRLLAAAVIGAPVLLVLAVIASSGLWSVQDYRYITPAFPLLAIPVGLSLAPFVRWIGRWWIAVAAVVAGVLAWQAVPGYVADTRLFAQGAMDTNTQVVAIGEYLHAKLPGARIMFHDAGAIAYYGDGEVYDMLGLVTNYQAGIANNGPGARFEFLESLPPDRRPDYFAYYPAWMGTNEFYGETVFHTPLHPGLDKRRLAGGSDMVIVEARWDHVGTGERPLGDHAGWAMVDRVDVADLASERAHGWHGELGRRNVGDPTARWSMVGREVGEHGLVLDGGRTIVGRAEQFRIGRDPGKPVRLVIRTGGDAGYPYQNAVTTAAHVTVNGVAATLPKPSGPFAEIVVELPVGATTDVAITSDAAYHVFHYFVLQPE